MDIKEIRRIRLEVDKAIAVLFNYRDEITEEQANDIHNLTREIV